MSEAFFSYDEVSKHPGHPDQKVHGRRKRGPKPTLREHMRDEHGVDDAMTRYRHKGGTQKLRDLHAEMGDEVRPSRPLLGSPPPDPSDAHKARVGAALRALREAKGMTQGAVADAMGTSQSNVSTIEAGKAAVSYDLLERYAEALGVPFAVQVRLGDDIVKRMDALAKAWDESKVKRHGKGAPGGKGGQFTKNPQSGTEALDDEDTKQQKGGPEPGLKKAVDAAFKTFRDGYSDLEEKEQRHDRTLKDFRALLDDLMVGLDFNDGSYRLGVHDDGIALLVDVNDSTITLPMQVGGGVAKVEWDEPKYGSFHLAEKHRGALDYESFEPILQRNFMDLYATPGGALAVIKPSYGNSGEHEVMFAGARLYMRVPSREAGITLANDMAEKFGNPAKWPAMENDDLPLYARAFRFAPHIPTSEHLLRRTGYMNDMTTDLLTTGAEPEEVAAALNSLNDKGWGLTAFQQQEMDDIVLAYAEGFEESRAHTDAIFAAVDDVMEQYTAPKSGYADDASSDLLFAEYEHDGEGHLVSLALDNATTIYVGPKTGAGLRKALYSNVPDDISSVVHELADKWAKKSRSKTVRRVADEMQTRKADEHLHRVMDQMLDRVDKKRNAGVDYDDLQYQSKFFMDLMGDLEGATDLALSATKNAGDDNDDLRKWLRKWKTTFSAARSALNESQGDVFKAADEMPLMMEYEDFITEVNQLLDDHDGDAESIAGTISEDVLDLLDDLLYAFETGPDGVEPELLVSMQVAATAYGVAKERAYAESVTPDDEVPARLHYALHEPHEYYDQDAHGFIERDGIDEEERHVAKRDVVAGIASKMVTLYMDGGDEAAPFRKQVDGYFAKAAERAFSGAMGYMFGGDETIREVATMPVTSLALNEITGSPAASVFLTDQLGIGVWGELDPHEAEDRQLYDEAAAYLNEHAPGWTSRRDKVLGEYAKTVSGYLYLRSEARNRIAGEWWDDFEVNVDSITSIEDAGKQLLIVKQTDELVFTWAQTAADHNGTSLALQHVASGQPWTKEGVDAAGLNIASDYPQLEVLNERGHIIKNFYDKMYEHTQESLAAEGYEENDTVLVYRGMGWNSDDSEVPAWAVPPASLGGRGSGERVRAVASDLDIDTTDTRMKTVNLNPLSSWASDYGTAVGFSTNTGGSTVGVVMVAEVPRHRIAGTARTGVGCLNEYEYVVTGNEPLDVALKWRTA